MLKVAQQKQKVIAMGHVIVDGAGPHIPKAELRGNRHRQNADA
jgi:RecA/RadA recombinase